MKNLIKSLLAAGLSALVIASGCKSLESRAEINRFEATALREGDSEDDWRLQRLFYQYIEDPKDNQFWQSPKVTIERGCGDCEDFAILSAFYSGKKYGNNILCLEGIDLIEKSVKHYHAVHLLEKSGKYGSREKYGDPLPPKYTLKELIIELGAMRSTRYEYSLIVNLDDMNKDWRTTKEDLVKDALRLYKQGKIKKIPVSDLK